MDMQTAIQRAGVVIGLVSAFDQTMPADSDAMLLAWATALADTNFTENELKTAVQAVYVGRDDVPKNRIGAVFAAAREVKKAERRQRREALEKQQRLALEAGPGLAGKPNLGVYRAESAEPGKYVPGGALAVECRTCGVDVGAFCAGHEGVLRFPHLARLIAALA